MRPKGDVRARSSSICHRRTWSSYRCKLVSPTCTGSVAKEQRSQQKLETGTDDHPNCHLPNCRQKCGQPKLTVSAVIAPAQESGAPANFALSRRQLEGGGSTVRQVPRLVRRQMTWLPPFERSVASGFALLTPGCHQADDPEGSGLDGLPDRVARKTTGRP